MKKALLTVLAILVFFPVVAVAQKSLEGTWKMNLDTVQIPKQPDVFLLQNGVFECKTCVPPIRVKADGQDQKVTGQPYFDMLRVRAVDNHTVEQTKKRGGKVVATEKDVVSSDGKTMTVEWTDSGQPAGGTQKGTFTMKRVAEGPKGANLFSGSWRAEKFDSPAAVLTWTYKLNGDEITMTNPTGQSYTAKLGGSEAPFKGDPGTTSVAVKMIGKDTLEEIDKRDGKVTAIMRMTVQHDGKTAKIVYEDKLQNRTYKVDVQKQM